LLLASHVAYLKGLFGGRRALTAWLGDWLLDDGTDARALLDRLRARRQLVGSAFTAEPGDHLATAKRAIFRRQLLYSTGALTILIPLLLAGWVAIGSYLRTSGGEHLPAWLVTLVTWLVHPAVWLYDTVQQAAAAHAGVPWVGDLAAAAVLSLVLVATAGPIGRQLTPLDPRDRRAGAS
jgi:hypothetical protein